MTLISRARLTMLRPSCPDPEDDQYAWVVGYWYPVEGHFYWHRGYWTRPPYVGAVWVVPHYEQGRYYGGYWEVHTGASSTTTIGTMTTIATKN